MAKDPAMLWYWNDWHSGTVLLSRFLKGCYIDLLHAQFNNGPLSLEEIKTCLGADFGNSWPALQKKFKQTDNGLFFNEKLEHEKQKRKDFSESRRNNIKKRYIEPTYVDTSVEHMKLHMENENENRNKDFKEGEKGVGKGEGFFWTDVVKNFFNDFNWKEKFCRDKNIEIAALEFKMKLFINDIELKEDFKELKELKNHFTNWFNKNSPAKHGSSINTNKGKSTGAHELLEELRAYQKPQ
jgi:hypothetical protein